MLLWGVLGVVVLLVAFVAWRSWATVRGYHRVQSDLLARIEPVARCLREGRAPAPEDLERLAADARTRVELFNALLFHQQHALFPRKYLTRPALSESQLVTWLLHPNELGAKPDEIELMAEVETEDATRKSKWLVFRFRMHAPHWAADRGWTAGVVGSVPVHDDPDPLPDASIVFSMFHAFESASPEQHVSAVRELMRKKGAQE